LIRPPRPGFPPHPSENRAKPYIPPPQESLTTPFRGRFVTIAPPRPPLFPPIVFPTSVWPDPLARVQHGPRRHVWYVSPECYPPRYPPGGTGDRPASLKAALSPTALFPHRRSLPVVSRWHPRVTQYGWIPPTGPVPPAHAGEPGRATDVGWTRVGRPGVPPPPAASGPKPVEIKTPTLGYNARHVLQRPISLPVEAAAFLQPSGRLGWI